MTTDGVALIYGACLLIGLAYSMMQFFFGALHGAGAGGHGINLGHGGHTVHVGHPHVHLGHGGHAAGGHASSLEDGTAPHSVSFINPLTLGTWVTTFGGFGLIALALLRSAPLSAILALATSFAATLVVFYLFMHLLIQPEVVRNMTPLDTVGLRGEVTVSVPGDQSMGQVAYVLDATRFATNARSEDGSPIPKGAAVRIVSATEQAVTVRQVEDDE
jgi:hypothetical protein